MKKYTKEQIRKAFKVWETKYRNNPDSFTDYQKKGVSVQKIADDNTDYLIKLIEENEN